MTGKRADDERELELKVTLLGAKPPIWRRLVVRESMNLVDLHRALQVAMGWFDDHLHAFDVKGKRYSPSHPGAYNDDVDSATVTLRDLRLRRRGTRFDYTYDFGDGWLHRIEVESANPLDREAEYPRCVGGRRACPPEDCGGIYGYERMLAIAGDPKHPEHEDVTEWLSPDFDPAHLDLEETNRVLRRVFGG